MDTDRVPAHPDLRTITLQQVLEAVVEPVRRSILIQLRDSPPTSSAGRSTFP